MNLAIIFTAKETRAPGEGAGGGGGGDNGAGGMRNGGQGRCGGRGDMSKIIINPPIQRGEYGFYL